MHFGPNLVRPLNHGHVLAQIVLLIIFHALNQILLQIVRHQGEMLRCLLEAQLHVEQAAAHRVHQAVLIGLLVLLEG